MAIYLYRDTSRGKEIEGQEKREKEREWILQNSLYLDIICFSSSLPPFPSIPNSASADDEFCDAARLRNATRLHFGSSSPVSIMSNIRDKNRQA
ncbi:hypothetical protein E2C01_074948 [Portunus trituberculatus]|uniref:Uncharacterized protein n=1 Tax=Portunus trituberculatus TaxID=210409 RepID=A0A5B7I771_PORTR|nr:hypothetical protein [Portunus trituberculatus]